MKFIFKTITLSLLLLFGCENVGLVETKLEFKEKIVVRAELTVDSTFAGVTLTRTLPINEQYDITKAEIKNAFSYLRINSVQIIPLHYEQDGLYKPTDDLKFKEGSTVELLGEAKGKSFYSKTIIPNNPSVNNPLRENNYVLASVNTHSDEVYGAAWIIYSAISNHEIDAAKNFQTIALPSRFDPTGNISVRTSDIPENYLVSPYLNQTYIQIYSFDKAYLEYYKSRNNNQISNNAFIQGGEAVVWNVQGEDVIGLFIGIAVGIIKLKLISYLVNGSLSLIT